MASKVWPGLLPISPGHYLSFVLSALVAYAALLVRRIALMHLGAKETAAAFIALCSFTTFALWHTIGLPVFSGAIVRDRECSAKGLTAVNIAVLVAICSITSAVGVPFWSDGGGGGRRRPCWSCRSRPLGNHAR